MAMLALLAGLVLAGGGGAADPLEWDGVTFRAWTDDASRLTFPLPLTQVLLESRHFPDATALQMTDVHSLSGPRGEVVELGVFRNAKRLPLDAFIREALPFLRVSTHVEMPWLATKERVPAMLFEHPRSSQQWATRAAVFPVGDRVVLVSCRNVEDRQAVAAFEAIVASLEGRPQGRGP